MPSDLTDSLAKLTGNSVDVLDADAYPEPGKATTQLIFSEGARLRIDYWRVIRDGKERVSSFDHEQQYGLPGPIDAVKELRTELQHKVVVRVQLDKETGDLLIQFTANIKLQVFGFSAYEVWEISFPDGTGEYSNHTKF